MPSKTPAQPGLMPVALGGAPKPAAKKKQAPKINRSADVMKRGYRKMGGM